MQKLSLAAGCAALLLAATSYPGYTASTGGGRSGGSAASRGSFGSIGSGIGRGSLSRSSPSGFGSSSGLGSSLGSRMTSPSIGTIPGRMTTPGIATTPGMRTTPGIATTPGRVTTPGLATTPGTVTTPGLARTPGTVTTPGTTTTPAATSQFLRDFNNQLLVGKFAPQQPPAPRPADGGRTRTTSPAPQAQRLPAADPRQSPPLFDLPAGGGAPKKVQGTDLKGAACVGAWDPSTHMSRQSWAATCNRVDQGR